jgi:hypothetical protein
MVVTSTNVFYNLLVEFHEIVLELFFLHYVGIILIEARITSIRQNIQAFQAKVGVNTNEKCIEPPNRPK